MQTHAPILCSGSTMQHSSTKMPAAEQQPEVSTGQGNQCNLAGKELRRPVSGSEVMIFGGYGHPCPLPGPICPQACPPSFTSTPPSPALPQLGRDFYHKALFSDIPIAWRPSTSLSASAACCLPPAKCLNTIAKTTHGLPAPLQH